MTSAAASKRRWALVLRKGEEVANAIPPDQLLVLQLEDLVLAQRERCYARLLEFVGLTDDDAMRVEGADQAS